MPPWEADTTAPYGTAPDDYHPGPDPLHHPVGEADSGEWAATDPVDMPSGRLGRALANRKWPLSVVLVAQALLSARLVRQYGVSG